MHHDHDDMDAIDAIERTATSFEALQACWRSQLQLAVHERMALSQLRQNGAMTMTHLAQRLALSRAAVTSLVDQLESRSYVERTSDAHDRRRTLVQLCAGTDDVLDRAAQPFNDAMRQWIDAHDSEQRELLLDFLHAWNDIASQLASECSGDST